MNDTVSELKRRRRIGYRARPPRRRHQSFAFKCFVIRLVGKAQNVFSLYLSQINDGHDTPADHEAYSLRSLPSADN